MFSDALNRQAIRRQIYKCNFSVTPALRRRFRRLSPQDAATLKKFTEDHYANTSDEGDLEKALEGALVEDRYANIPWLNAALALDGARVLEIGCGTGESTLALAEQGAHVTGLDIDGNALDVGKRRIELHGLSAEFVVGNASDLATVFSGETFDAVIFFASLEHMTHEERLNAMAVSWSLIRSGGIWSVIEAPNRLWYWDGHTSMSNFFHWLPDDLAWKWAKYAKREAFAQAICSEGEIDRKRLARWGRGISFHEFDVAFGAASTLDVVSDKTGFLRRHNPLMLAHGMFSRTGRYERFMHSLEPDVHRGFFRQYLDLIIRKA